MKLKNMDILKIYDEQSSKWQEIPAIKGSNGLYVGDTEPTDPDIHVWIDTTGNSIQLVDYIYPVGSIYISVNDTSPSTLFGGVWEQIKDTFLLSAGDTYTAGETGGEAEHTLTVDEMPEHEHTMTSYYDDANYNHATIPPDNGPYSLPYDGGSTTIRTQHTNMTGGGQAHNNMPPYLTVYMWKRLL